MAMESDEDYKTEKPLLHFLNFFYNGSLSGSMDCRVLSDIAMLQERGSPAESPSITMIVWSKQSVRSKSKDLGR
jgi:hypothetical protein